MQGLKNASGIFIFGEGGMRKICVLGLAFPYTFSIILILHYMSELSPSWPEWQAIVFLLFSVVGYVCFAAEYTTQKENK